MTIRPTRWIRSDSGATCLLLGLLFGLALLLPASAGAQQPPRREVESYLEIYDLKTGQRQVVHREEGRFEAPNWTNDGQFLLINRQGKLYRLPVKGGSPQEIPTGFANQLNNDHGISPDGKMLAVSHNNREIAPRENSAIYVVPIEGGTPRLVTRQVPSYWHGWSPNGRLLAYVAKRNGDFNIFTIRRGATLLCGAVPPRSHAHRAGQGDPGALCAGHLRSLARLDHGPLHRRGRGQDPRAGGR